MCFRTLLGAWDAEDHSCPADKDPRPLMPAPHTVLFSCSLDSPAFQHQVTSHVTQDAILSWLSPSAGPPWGAGSLLPAPHTLLPFTPVGPGPIQLTSPPSLWSLRTRQKERLCLATDHRTWASSSGPLTASLLIPRPQHKPLKTHRECYQICQVLQNGKPSPQTLGFSQ